MIKTLHKVEGLGRLVFSSLNNFEKSGVQEGISLKYVQKGVEAYKIDDIFFDVKAGDYLLVDHLAPFEATIDTETETTGFCLYFDKSLYYQACSTIVQENYDNKNIYQDKFKLNDNYAGKLFSSVISKVRSGKCELSEDIYFDIVEAVSIDQKTHKNIINKIDAIKLSTREEIYRRLRVAVEYMSDNSCAGLSTPLIARNCGMSEFHFYRSFKSVFGTSPQRFLSKIRIDKAKEMLSTQNHSVKEIAKKLGFVDNSHLSRVFKSITGQSPIQFLKNQQVS